MSFLTSTVAVVIHDHGGRVLLCQQSQGHRLWVLPGGRIRPNETPMHAIVRSVREESGAETDIIDLVGIYHLTAGDGGNSAELPDVLVHVFRGRLTAGDVTVNAPGRISRLAWCDPATLPEPIAATTRCAVADAIDGRSGVLREVHRDAEPELADAESAATGDQQSHSYADVTA